MSESRVALLGISNAIVDVLAHVSHDIVDQLGAPPGSMTLVNAVEAQQRFLMMDDPRQSAGGSVANSIACFASLGGHAAYIGRVADDIFGNAFADDMQSLGVDLRLKPETREAPTARCHVFITPGGERTMQTYLGACVEIAPTDITEATIGAPRVLLLEGYVWDTPDGPESMNKAVQLAKANGADIALSLSDSFCVERHQHAFEALAQGDADIIIGNEAEVFQLFGVENFEQAATLAAESGKLFAITRSEHGSVIIRGNERHDQPADVIDKIEDATGAGDAYIAGFLYGYTRQQSFAESAALATACASLAIQQVGARPPAAELAALVR